MSTSSQHNGRINKSNGRYKSRLCACGNRMPKDGSFEAYAPTPRLSTVRVLLKQVVQNGWSAGVADCSTAFLNARLDHPMYCRLPPGNQQPGEDEVMKVTKAVYGACQSRRLWHDLLHNWMTTRGYRTSPPCVTGIIAMTNATQLAGLYLWVLHLYHGLPAFNNAQLTA